MFVKNIWYVAAWADEVKSTPLARRICNEPIVIYRALDGKPAALLDACCHRGAPLSLGTVVEAGIRCNYHGNVFDGTGACVHIPGHDRIPKKARVRSYPLVEKDQILWVWMGDAARANHSLIPDYQFHNDSANWPHRHAVMPCKADYVLLVDNLLDVTHLAYVHVETVGGSVPKIHFDAQTHVTETNYGITVHRHMRSVIAPPIYSNSVSFPALVDRWQEFDFWTPNACIQYSGAIEANHDRSDMKCARFDMRIFHGWTPVTETTSLYFWSVANGHRTDLPQTTSNLVEQMEKTFAEDKAMVEAQQSRISELGEKWMVDTSADAPRVMMRRSIQRQLATEAQPSSAAT